MSYEYPTVIYLCREEFPRLLEAELCPRSSIAVRLGLKAGLRPIEIRRVTCQDLDPGSRQLRVHYCSRSKPRTVPIDTETIDLIDDFERGLNPGQPIIRPERGYEMRSGPILSEQLLCLLVKEAARAAGIRAWRRFYPYLLRHFFAADWITKGGNVYTLSRILGHASLATTTIYLSRLVFWRNHLREYDRIQGEYPKMEENTYYKEWCRKCDREPVCMFIDVAGKILPPSLPCRQFKPREKP